MNNLRKPFFILALALIALAVLIEIGATGFIRATEPDDAAIRALVVEQAEKEVTFQVLTPGQKEAEIDRRVQRVKEEQAAGGSRPGIGIPYLALLDAVVLFAVGLIGASLVVKESTQARLQGCLTLIFGVLLALLGIVLLIAAITLLLFMLGLLSSPPFGPLTYIALFAFFNKGGALATLGLLLLLKLGFGGSLLAAQQAFLKNCGLVLLVLTSIIANIIVAFLIGLVPGFLASVTDAIAGIVVAVLALIWLLVVLIGSIGAVIRALKPA